MELNNLNILNELPVTQTGLNKKKIYRIYLQVLYYIIAYVYMYFCFVTATHVTQFGIKQTKQSTVTEILLLLLLSFKFWDKKLVLSFMLQHCDGNLTWDFLFFMPALYQFIHILISILYNILEMLQFKKWRICQVCQSQMHEGYERKVALISAQWLCINSLVSQVANSIQQLPACFSSSSMAAQAAS